jgi:anti-sigma factor (TIGR02949 family)
VPCELAQKELHGYLDGELDALDAANFEQHLAACPDCKQVLAAGESLRNALHQADLYERAPDSLREKLLGKPQKQAAEIPAPRVYGISWQWLAAAALILLAALLGWRQWLDSQNVKSEQLMAATLVDAHLRSLQPGHLTDVESTDQHTVKPWFDGRLDFAPPVRDFSDAGFPLLGGRLDVVEGRTVAALVYGRRKHIVNVFVDRTQPEESWNGAGVTQGYHWLAWQKDGFTFFAVSDTAAGDLDQLKRLFLSP